MIAGFFPSGHKMKISEGWMLSRKHSMAMDFNVRG